MTAQTVSATVAEIMVWYNEPAIIRAETIDAYSIIAVNCATKDTVHLWLAGSISDDTVAALHAGEIDLRAALTTHRIGEPLTFSGFGYEGETISLTELDKDQAAKWLPSAGFFVTHMEPTPKNTDVPAA